MWLFRKLADSMDEAEHVIDLRWNMGTVATGKLAEAFPLAKKVVYQPLDMNGFRNGGCTVLAVFEVTHVETYGGLRSSEGKFPVDVVRLSSGESDTFVELPADDNPFQPGAALLCDVHGSYSVTSFEQLRAASRGPLLFYLSHHERAGSRRGLRCPHFRGDARRACNRVKQSISRASRVQLVTSENPEPRW